MSENYLVMEASQADHPKGGLWLASLYASVATFVGYLPFVLFGAADLGPLLYILLALIVSVALLVLLALREGRRWPLLSAIAAFWIVSAVLVMNTMIVRDFARWTVWADGYKATVLGHDPGNSGELQHALWDGWGWGGSDTNVYLVFDPKDGLGAATTTRVAGRVAGLPREVLKVLRLERHWYAVTFYTDTSWDSCG